MVDLYNFFDEMQGLYDKFTKNYETLKTHHDCMRETSTAFEQVTIWHVKEKLHDLLILDKLQAKTTKVMIETWEGICDSIENLINEGHMACNKKCSDAKTFLAYFDLLVLEPISQAPSRKLQLE